MYCNPVQRVSGRCVAAAVALMTLTSLALGQNNDLLHPRGSAGGQVRQIPTTQPSGALTPGVIQIRSRVVERGPEPLPNAGLLHVSPYAVQVPQPEEIAVHDLITIIVRESKTATSDGKIESKKDWTLEAELEKWIRLSDKHGIVPADLLQGNPAIAFESQDDYSGDGSYDRKDELTTRITAKVIDVKPNGNLIVEAPKQITIDDEGYTITLTGECRSKDVTPENTILSTQIYNPVIDVQHTGTVRDATRRGWLKRFVDFLRPF